MSILDAALEYADNGLSVIPIQPGGKRAIVKWEEYQKRIATHEEISSWFEKWPDANIAIVTGAISKIGVVDLDTKEAIEWARKNLPQSNIIQKTGKGEQWLYQSNGVAVPQGTNMVEGVNGVDCRGDGGYIVAAPSIHPTGALYEMQFFYGDWSDLPYFPYDLFKPKSEDIKPPVTLDPVIEGERNTYITRLAGKYFAKGLSYEEVFFMCKGYNLSCEKPLPEKEIKVIVDSIYKKEMSSLVLNVDSSPQSGSNVTSCTQNGDSDNRNWGTITSDIRGFVEQNTGNFTNFDIDREFGYVTRNEKQARSKALCRIEKEGKIKKIPNSPGKYRILDYDLDKMDFSKPDLEPFSLEFPLDIGNLAYLYPGNIVIVAGTSNAGKTGFLLSSIEDTLERERKKEPKKERERVSAHGGALTSILKNGIRYLNSEMSPEEIMDWNKTLGSNLHEDVEFIYRTQNFQDAINPDGLNIIDYLEVYDEFYKIGSDIAAIHENLNKGVAIIAIQKKHGSEYAIGGQFSAWKARLVINLESIQANVKVAKLAKIKKPVDPENNHEGMELDYVISKSEGFRKITDWRYLTIKQRKATNEYYKAHGIKLPKRKKDGYKFNIQLQNGDYAGITTKTVKTWQTNFENIDVVNELMRIQDLSEYKPFLKKDGWFHQLSGILKKKNET